MLIKNLAACLASALALLALPMACMGGETPPGIRGAEGSEADEKSIGDPSEGSFADPLGRFVVRVSAKGSLLEIFDVERSKTVFTHPVEGSPVLGSAAIWYQKGGFYFALPHRHGACATVWRMYDWAFVKKVETEGNASSLSTHPRTPYIWAAGESDRLTLIDKRDFSTRKITPFPGKRALRAEFSADGKAAYVIMDGERSSTVVYDAATLKAVSNSGGGPSSETRDERKRLLPVHLGQEVFMAKCWGCHHPMQAAFGPSFRWIAANRDEGVVRAQIADPSSTYKVLGYKRNSMPKIELGEEEFEVLMSFIKESAHAQDN